MVDQILPLKSNHLPGLSQARLNSSNIGIKVATWYIMPGVFFDSNDRKLMDRSQVTVFPGSGREYQRVDTPSCKLYKAQPY